MKKPDKPTRTLAMLAKCHDCQGAYADGVTDCEVYTCPLYSWMPRRQRKPDITWIRFNPRKKGWVRWEDCGRELTDEQRAEAAERLARARATKTTEEDPDLGF